MCRCWLVRDNGPGIPDDIRPHLFEAFVTSKSSGSGLGLALVAKIIGDHGGLIEVDAAPDELSSASTFRCWPTKRPTSARIRHRFREINRLWAIPLPQA